MGTRNRTHTLSIANTDAPHMNYDIECINDYCNQLDAYLSTVPYSLTKMWRADNDGELSADPIAKKYIGKWTLTNKTDKGNGKT